MTDVTVTGDNEVTVEVGSGIISDVSNFDTTGLQDGELVRYDAAAGQLERLDLSAAAESDLVGLTAAGVPKIVGKDTFRRVLVLEEQPGVSTDGTECGAAIQTAIDKAETDGRELITNGPNVFVTNQSLQFRKSCDLWEATFDFTGTTGEAIIVGDEVNGITRQRIIIGRVVASAKTDTGWAQVAGSVGVKIVDVNKSVVVLKSTTKFETGLLLWGEARGTTYNRVYPGELANNKRNIDWGTGTTNGYTNQNILAGGSCKHEPAEGTAVAGTRHMRMTDANPFEADGNLILGMSFESSGVVEYDLECYGLYNTFLGCRWEHSGADNPKVYWGSGAIGNVIRDGHSVEDIEVTNEDATADRNKIAWYGSGDIDEIVIDPGDLIPVLGAPTQTHIARHPVFSCAADEGGGDTITFPPNWNTYDVKLHVTHNEASGGTTSWLWRTQYKGDGETVTTVGGGTTRTVTLGATNVKTVATLETGLSVTEDEQASANLLRITGGTFTGRAGVMAVVLRRRS